MKSSVRRSPGPVKREMPERVLVGGNAVARSEPQRSNVVYVAGAAEIERGKAFVPVHVPVRRKQFAAERKVFSKIALHEPAAVGRMTALGHGGGVTSRRFALRLPPYLTRLRSLGGFGSSDCARWK